MSSKFKDKSKSMWIFELNDLDNSTSEKMSGRYSTISKDKKKENLNKKNWVKSKIKKKLSKVKSEVNLG